MMASLNQTYASSSIIYFNIVNDSANDYMDREVMESLPYSPHSWILQILEQMRDARTFDPSTEALLILAFSVFITFGALGNGLVCFVVARNSHMRTPRNIFIINLAISDLTLCVFTQPLNLYLLIKTQWELGSFMCKFVTMLQGTNLFVSTISITAIALDRFQVIVYPTKESMKQVGAAIGLLSVWVISFLMASPALLFQVLDAKAPLKHEYPDFIIYNCIEDQQMNVEKRAYTVAQMVVQYILPFIILTVAHLRICNKLRYRMVNQQQQQQAKDRQTPHQPRTSQQERRSRRKRKTNLLLASIALVFALSWLPLNIFNLLSEFHRELFFTSRFNRTSSFGAEDNGLGEENRRSVDINLAYAICHLLVLCSACLNPVVYGWFNDNFKSEFIKILCCPCCKQLQASIKKMLCCAQRKRSIPSITLTKASNGGGLGGGGADDLGAAEKLTVCKIDDDITSVTYTTIVKRTP